MKDGEQVNDVEEVRDLKKHEAAAASLLYGCSHHAQDAGVFFDDRRRDS